MDFIFDTDYPNGLEMDKFEHVKDISHYNFNYYKGVKSGDILNGVSDDDNTTEWWVIRNQTFYYLGESYCTNGEKLVRFKEQCT